MYERSEDSIPLRGIISGHGKCKPLPTKDLAGFIFSLKFSVDKDDIYDILRV